MLSEKATNISPAATIEISARIAELRRQGTNIISLNIGEPDYPTPEISHRQQKARSTHTSPNTSRFPAFWSCARRSAKSSKLTTA